MDTKNLPRVKGKFLVSKPLFLGSRLVLGGVYMAIILPFCLIAITLVHFTCIDGNLSHKDS